MLVSIASFTTMARSAVTPAACAMAVLARTPQDTTTSCAGITSPLPSRTPVTLPLPSRAAICTPSSTRTPRAAQRSSSSRAEGSSSWRPMRVGASSSTVTLQPLRCSSEAASRPSTPPPMTTACVSGDMARTRSTSAMRRMATTPSRSWPGMGGTKHSLPSAKMSLV